jgi:hypothetical protein
MTNTRSAFALKSPDQRSAWLKNDGYVFGFLHYGTMATTLMHILAVLYSLDNMFTPSNWTPKYLYHVP